MTVKPIIFNTYMVRATLDNRKTTTRRVIKPQPPKDIEYIAFNANVYCAISWSEKSLRKKARPPYQPDDILYVRETWQYAYEMDEYDQIIEGTGRYLYRADNPMPFSYWVDPTTGEHKDYTLWKPSIHMPKEAARIWLKVTDVRAERLQKMSIPDIRCEGLQGTDFEVLKKYIEFWNSTIKKKDLPLYGWDANPWVWVIEFERTEKPDK